MSDIDWQKVVHECADAGMKLSGIARLCGTTKHTIEHLSKGKTKEPRYGAGVKLLELRARLVNGSN